MLTILAECWEKVLTEEKDLRVLQSDLQQPKSIAAFGDRLLFTETGTSDAKYRDGKLSTFDPETQEITTLADELNYPTSLFVDSDGGVYVIEAGATSTSFGGHDRLLYFPPKSSQFEVLLADLKAPKAVAVDPAGTIYVGTGPKSSYRDTAALLMYPKGQTRAKVLVSNLPDVPIWQSTRMETSTSLDSVMLDMERVQVTWRRSRLSRAALRSQDHSHEAPMPGVLQWTRMGMRTTRREKIGADAPQERVRPSGPFPQDT